MCRYICENNYPNMQTQSLGQAVLIAEYNLISEALKKTGFNKSKAAELLNIDRKTLYNKIKRYQKEIQATSN